MFVDQDLTMDKIKMFLEHWWVALAMITLTPFFWLAAQFFAEYANIINGNFFKIWLAANMTWTGADPYSPADWLNGHQAAGSNWVPEKGFLYPLPVAYLLSPLGLFSPHVAYIVWASLSMLACATAIFMLVNAWDESRLKVFALLLLIAAFLFAPMLETVGKGTIGGLLLIGVACAIELFRRKKSFAGGILFSILLLKPQLGVPILAVMGLWMLIRRDWHGLSGMAAGALLLFLIGAAGDLQWVEKFMQASQQKFGLAFGAQPTLFSMASLLCANGSACTLWMAGLFSLALAAPVIYILYRKANELSALQVFSLAAPLGMLGTPYLWSYDHVLLIIAFVWLAYQLIRRTEKYTFAMLFLIVLDIAAGTGLYFRGILSERDFWNFVTPLVTLILVVWFAMLPPLMPKITPEERAGAV
jgi:hypothetical protein